MTDRLKTVYPPKTSFCGGIMIHLNVLRHVSLLICSMCLFNYMCSFNQSSVANVTRGAKSHRMKLIDIQHKVAFMSLVSFLLKIFIKFYGR